MTKAIIGGTILTGLGTVIEEGTIIIQNGRLAYVGTATDVPKEAEIFEAKNKIISPGFVDAHSHIGLIPEGLDWEYSDVNDFSGPITAQLRAIDGLDIYDPAFQEAVEGGVTTVYTGPGSANVIGGIGLTMKTAGPTLKSRLLNSRTAIKIALGPKRQRGPSEKEPYPTTRMGTVALLRDWLLRARELIEGRVDKGEIDFQERQILELLAEAINQKLLVKIHLSTSPDEIHAALKLIKEFHLKATIDHVFGGQLVVEEILESGVPVIYGPPMITKLYSAFRYVSDEAPVIMSKNGISVSVMTDHPVVPEKHLRLLASIVIRNGASVDEALRMITLNPAKALGIVERVGSLEVGKDADLVISNAHPLMPYAIIEEVFINGQLVYPTIEIVS